ncbi:MAG: AAA family ATPase [Saprospiraceae bacterium]
MKINELIPTKQTEQDFYRSIAQYLFAEKTRGSNFIISKEAAELYETFLAYLKKQKGLKRFRQSVEKMQARPVAQFQLIRQWVEAFMQQTKVDHYQQWLNETVVLLQVDNFSKKHIINATTTSILNDLHGEHSVVQDGKYQLDYVAFMQKMRQFVSEKVPQFQQFQQLKKDLTTQYKQQMRLNEFQPRVLSSFVRNQLIDQVYLPLVGDNLAKQIGTVGVNTRTDRMGLLLLISPPGYGKTTLMEYIANRLGLIFMKINGPAIGHEVTNIDPASANHTAAKQELEKLNLALEMGDNVMLYLDDIQHCHPEFLQKFISLCDAQRKIEGVYKNQSKTYDLRGKRFCVIMAGNPYTESGEQFQIPDMLANRADIYNLGDIIGDSAGAFKLSYIENALTSNAILARLAGKSLKDVRTLLRVAETDNQEEMNLEANHSPEELNEYLSLLKKMLHVRDVILLVNQQYIKSAATADDYRTEPAFKLQGSYRDMNKLAEKIVPIMNQDELDTLILSHYTSESQTLTSNAEANLLKFKAMTNQLSAEEAPRWEEICKTFSKNKSFDRFDPDNPMAQVIGQMQQFNEGIEGIRKAMHKWY